VQEEAEMAQPMMRADLVVWLVILTLLLIWLVEFWVELFFG